MAASMVGSRAALKVASMVDARDFEKVALLAVLSARLMVVAKAVLSAVSAQA